MSEKNNTSCSIGCLPLLIAVFMCTVGSSGIENFVFNQSNKTDNKYKLYQSKEYVQGMTIQDLEQTAKAMDQDIATSDRTHWWMLWVYPQNTELKNPNDAYSKDDAHNQVKSDLFGKAIELKDYKRMRNNIQTEINSRKK